jgi:molybdopterin-binding protein
LAAQVLAVQQNETHANVTVLLPSGETLIVNMTPQSLENLKLSVGKAVWMIFKSNMPYLGSRE